MKEWSEYELFLNSEIQKQKIHITFLESRIQDLNNCMLPQWVEKYNKLLDNAKDHLTKLESELTIISPPPFITVIAQSGTYDMRHCLVRVECDGTVYRIVMAENNLILANITVLKPTPPSS